MIRKFLFSLAFTFAFIGFVLTPTADAVGASEWRAGHIISDSIFFNSSTMSANEIQAFLNAQVPGCDTWGQKMYSTTQTRAQRGTSKGVPPPYVCLKDYQENPTTKANNLTTAGAVDGGWSAARIIKYAADMYNVSPKALIVLLQKEQGLVTDEWPWPGQYRSATGYGCPDTAPCDAEYYGFYNQVVNAAKAFRRYATYPQNYRYKAGQDNFVQYNPNASCSGTNVFIQNQATAGLYIYTPYQPNVAALNNLYGTGDSCSAYGNRNFWRMYNDWFGTTSANALPLPISVVTLSAREATVGQKIWVSYKITNPMSISVTLPSVGISNRMNGKMYDFGIESNVAFAPNETKTFIATFTPDSSGAYAILPVYNYGGVWHGGKEAVSWLNVHYPSLEVSSKLTTSPEFPLVGESYSINYSIKNKGTLTAYITNLMAANMDGDVAKGFKALNIELAPGQTYNYTDTRINTATTQQTAWIAYQLGNGWYRLGDNFSYRSYSSPASLSLSSPLTLGKKYPVINDALGITFKVKNTGDQPIRLNNLGVGVTRNSDSSRFDYSSQQNGIPGVIKGGQEYTYNQSRSLPTKDIYSFFLTESLDGATFTDTLIQPGTNAPTSISSQTYSSPAKLDFTTPIKTQQSSGPLSHIVDVTYTVKNTGDAPTDKIILAFYCRQNSTFYCDIPGSVYNIKGGESATLSKSLGYFSGGKLTFKALKYDNNSWSDFGQTATVDISSSPPPQSAFKTTMTLEKTTAAVNTPITVTYTVQNVTNSDLQVPLYAVASRLNGRFYDFGIEQWFYLRSGETKTFTKQFTTATPGTYTLFPVLKTANESWYGYYPQDLTVK